MTLVCMASDIFEFLKYSIAFVVTGVCVKPLSTKPSTYSFLCSESDKIKT